MPARGVRVAVLGLFVGLAVAATRAAEDDPLPTLRQLCLDTPAVVVAVPTDPATPLRFRVQSVLRGPLKVGDTVAPVGLQAEQVRTRDESNRIEGKPRSRLVAAALLFLERRAGGAWKLVPGGLRFCTDDGTVLAPVDRRGTLKAREEARWTVVVARVRDDLASLEQLESYRRLGRPGRRVQALLGWVQKRKAEF